MDISLRLRSGTYSVTMINTRYVENRSGLFSKLHSHPVYHLMYITGGSGTFQVNGTDTEATEGLLYLISPNEPHQFAASREHPLSNYASTFMLVAEDERPSEDSLFDLIEEYYGHALPESVRRSPLLIPSPFRSFITEGFQQIIHHQQLLHDDLQGKLRQIELVFRIFDVVQRIGLTKVRAKKQNTVAGLLTFIQSNLHRSLTLEELADHIHMTPNYLCRLFKREMGVTPHRYLQTLRMEKAEKLLLYTDDPVYLIAEQLGFEDVSYFSRVFRTEKGLTPTAYRDLKRPGR
ncbi:helix-turn-helix domain-containing protein [Paenibacillus allorhizosphaerae]|uniref:HTH-type transcriptional activator RhaS n=1 Tax=Paenibacillus allorhizosphaerae TaxID=2849866 RepID=A0ABN7THN2_9BACL|nr:AraC family transcriptional regulator [Paenibacillus allorhizosphaerae]CAG7628305.1 HTH-type transcriptional activator RhaS [Paenibacillus allorhizosphaerae]